MCTAYREQNNPKGKRTGRFFRGYFTAVKYPPVPVAASTRPGIGVSVSVWCGTLIVTSWVSYPGVGHARCRQKMQQPFIGYNQ